VLKLATADSDGCGECKSVLVIFDDTVHFQVFGKNVFDFVALDLAYELMCC